MNDPIEESVKSLLSFLDKKDTINNSTYIKSHDVLTSVLDMTYKHCMDEMKINEKTMNFIMNTICLSYLASISMTAATDEKEKEYIIETISCFASPKVLRECIKA